MEICIIKLGADGDVLRTIPLAVALKNKYPESKITWITKGEIGEMLKTVGEIDEVKVIPYSENKKYDLVYNFDFDKEACQIVSEIYADKKYGFYMDGGYPGAFNFGAEYYLNTMFDDSLKKKNKKTYQEMMFEAAEVVYKKERYEIKLEDKEKAYADEFIKKNKINTENLIGIHIGASSRWPSKVWHKDKVKRFIELGKEKGYDILLFGGPNEVKEQKELIDELSNSGLRIYHNNPKNTKLEFASLIDKCKFIVCSDSFSLHVALALNKKTIGLFFCTSPDEVEGYDLLTKIVSPLLNNFFPEKSDIYDIELVNSISAEIVIESIEKAE